MKRKISILLLSFLNMGYCSKAQIKKIEFSAFTVNSPLSKEKNKTEIFTYAEISETGFIKLMDRDEYNDSISNYTYQLKADEIKKIELIFNSKKELKSHLTSQSLKKGDHYSGNYYSFISSYKDNKKDDLYFIESYMSVEFNDMFKLLKGIFYGKQKLPSSSRFSIPKNLKETLFLGYTNNKYLPIIEFPPPEL